MHHSLSLCVFVGAMRSNNSKLKNHLCHQASACKNNCSWYRVTWNIQPTGNSWQVVECLPGGSGYLILFLKACLAWECLSILYLYILGVLVDLVCFSDLGSFWDVYLRSSRNFLEFWSFHFFNYPMVSSTSLSFLRGLWENISLYNFGWPGVDLPQTHRILSSVLGLKVWAPTPFASLINAQWKSNFLTFPLISFFFSFSPRWRELVVHDIRSLVGSVCFKGRKDWWIFFFH